MQAFNAAAVAVSDRIFHGVQQVMIGLQKVLKGKRIGLLVVQ